MNPGSVRVWFIRYLAPLDMDAGNYESRNPARLNNLGIYEATFDIGGECELIVELDEKETEDFAHITPPPQQTRLEFLMQTHQRDKEVVMSGSAIGATREVGRQRVQLEFTPEALERLRQIRDLAN